MQAQFYIRNRERLIASADVDFIVISANSALQYSADIAYKFRQESNFWYLTGLNTPDAVLIIDCGNNRSSLILPQQNEYQSEWDGQNNEQKLKTISGIDEFIFKYELNQILNSKNIKNKKVGYLPQIGDDNGRVEPYGFYANPARARVKRELLELNIDENNLIDMRTDIARLRQVKQPEEIKAIQKAIDITAASLNDSRSKLPEFESEKDLERYLISRFYAHGGDGEGFDSIIASGKNAATIHYVDNDALMQPSDLVLLDVGAKYGGYAADISRTWSISRKPSQRQQDIWQACVDLQTRAIERLKAGVILKEMQLAFEKDAKQTFTQLNCSMQDRPFPHGLSHHLGIDVHDAGLYHEPLPEDAVITVEPGIYLPDENIGVRVEDNVLITKTGVKNLSAKIPKLL